MTLINISTRFYKILSITSIILIAVSCKNQINVDEENWKNLDQILSQIEEPKFPANEYNILDFGASLDSTISIRSAVQSAIDVCSEKGGGKVIIPKGTYLSNGTIFLKSNVNLHFEEGAKLNFSTNPSDYLPLVFTRWEGIECYNYSALFYAKDQINIAITGKGILDGKASSKNWWPWKGKVEYGFNEGSPSQLDSLSRPRLLKMNNRQDPVESRVFGEGHYLRPNFFQTINCKNILLEDVTFIDSPMWFLHPVLSENIIVRGVTVVGKGPNNDGLDPESCKNVLIEGCVFDTGDDCIAIKSGRNADGRRINVPSENIVVRNCRMKDGHGGVVIGSEISGGCKNVFAEDCVMDSPNLDRAIRIKTNTIRGGIVENIFVRNIQVGEVKEAVLKINLKYEPNEIGERNFTPTVRNIYLTNIESEKSNRAFYLDGLIDSQIKDVYVINSNLKNVSTESILNNLDNFFTEEVYINGKLFNN
jgi:polygalacturonase